jgi:hypothetical protein
MADVYELSMFDKYCDSLQVTDAKTKFNLIFADETEELSENKRALPRFLTEMDNWVCE